MQCDKPLEAWRARYGVRPVGERRLVFKREEGIGPPLEIPCGRCMGCRLEKSRQVALRCMHEAQLHQENCAITLTYADEHLPYAGSLVVHHWQDFMKRFRARIAPLKIRSYMCGEYGERLGRPHYHGLIFGFDFARTADSVHVKTNHLGDKQWIAPLLADLWKFGNHLIGGLTFESAAYVARYVTKKVSGPAADDGHYGTVDELTGEWRPVTPEFALMSRGGRKRGRAGIGAGWYEKYGSEVFPSDEVIVGGRRSKPPQYYDRCLAVDSPEVHQAVKEARVSRAKKRRSDNTPERRRVRSVVRTARMRALKRSYESEA